MKTIFVARSKKNDRYFRETDTDWGGWINDVEIPIFAHRFSGGIEHVCLFDEHQAEDIEFVELRVSWEEVRTIPHPDVPKLRGTYRGSYPCDVVRAHNGDVGFVITIPDKFGGKHWLDAKREDLCEIVVLDQDWATKYWSEA